MAEYTPLEQQLIQNIKESFNYHLVSNASFLAEKLLAEKDNEETRLILAECYFAEAKHNMVYQLLKSCQSSACRYLFSMAAIRLNKTDQAEATLLRIDRTPEAQGGGNPYANYLLGEAFERSGKEEEAVKYYKLALDKNPYLWVAFEKICKLTSSKELSSSEGLFKEPAKKYGRELEAPMAIFQALSEKDVPKKNILLEGQSEPAVGLKPLSLASAARKPVNQISRDKKENSIQAFATATGTKDNLLSLLTSLASPYFDMVRFNCKRAIEKFGQLSKKQLNTGWTHVNIGRCYMDLGDNEKAEEAFAAAFAREPYRVKGMEYYSSCLWQLKKQKELCDLAFSVIEYNQFAPEAWIALGNCFSLQRDHESALNFFHRAIQLDPRFSYAHCLKGHEYIYGDQFVKSKNCYELALKTDRNNFHAWWGLGNVSLKQEKYDRALEYFNKANQLNNKNSVIHSYIGIVMEKMDRNPEALAAFKRSEELNPKALMTRFHKTQIYYKMGDYSNALCELEQLINLSPKESQLYIMIGNVYKRLGNSQKALQYYMSAQDLENKESQRVKNLIDALTNNNQFNNFEIDAMN
jgi:anaphase-promoting complex subunit 3